MPFQEETWRFITWRMSFIMIHNVLHCMHSQFCNIPQFASLTFTYVWKLWYCDLIHLRTLMKELLCVCALGMFTNALMLSISNIRVHCNIDFFFFGDMVITVNKSQSPMHTSSLSTVMIWSLDSSHAQPPSSSLVLLLSPFLASPFVWPKPPKIASIKAIDASVDMVIIIARVSIHPCMHKWMCVPPGHVFHCAHLKALQILR